MDNAGRSFHDFVIANKVPFTGYAVNACNTKNLPLYHRDELLQKGLGTTWEVWPQWLVVKDVEVQRAYVFKAINHHAWNASRKNGVEQRHVDYVDHDTIKLLPVVHTDDPDQIILARTALTRVAEALHKLPQPEQEMIQMKMVGLNQRAIAEVLGISQAMVSRRLKKACAALARAVGDEAMRELGLGNEGGDVA